MAGALDRKMRALALRLCARFGKPFLLRRKTAGAYSPATGEQSAVTFTDHSVTAVVTRFTPAEIAASMAEAPDVKVIIPASGLAVVPAKGDELLFGEGLETTESAYGVPSYAVPGYWVTGYTRLQLVADAVAEYSGAEVAFYVARARG